MEENLPPGFRFHPTDEELISYYLTSKVSDASGFTSKAIAVVDLNKTEPWDLPGKACMGKKEWYFFSLRDRKYPTGIRTNRATESGYWKTTGKDREIFGAATEVLLGMKKTLVFYKGRAPRGEKTNWVMHEYRLHNASKEEWVVCRVFQKSIPEAKKPQETSSSQLSLESSPNLGDTASMVNEFGDVELPNFSYANSSSGLTFTNHNTALAQSNNFSGDQYYSSTNNSYNNVHTNMNLSMNWAAAAATTDHQAPSLPSLSLPWPIMLNPNLYVNSLQLLKALQLKNYQQASDHFVSHVPQGVASQFAGGTDLISNYLNASSSKVLDCLPQQQQQQEQPFNMDSAW